MSKIKYAALVTGLAIAFAGQAHAASDNGNVSIGASAGTIHDSMPCSVEAN